MFLLLVGGFQWRFWWGCMHDAQKHYNIKNNFNILNPDFFAMDTQTGL